MSNSQNTVILNEPSITTLKQTKSTRLYPLSSQALTSLGQYGVGKRAGISKRSEFFYRLHQQDLVHYRLDHRNLEKERREGGEEEEKEGSKIGGERGGERGRIGEEKEGGEREREERERGIVIDIHVHVKSHFISKINITHKYTHTHCTLFA